MNNAFWTGQNNPGGPEEMRAETLQEELFSHDFFISIFLSFLYVVVFIVAHVLTDSPVKG